MITEDDYEHIDHLGFAIFIQKECINQEPINTETYLGLVKDGLQRLVDGRINESLIPHMQRARFYIDLHTSGNLGLHFSKAYFRPEWGHFKLQQIVSGNLIDDLLNVQRFPDAIMHEYAHILHHRWLDFRNKTIILNYQRVLQEGLYKGVKCKNEFGDFVNRADPWVLKNPQEYFATSSVSFLGDNDWEPRNREELWHRDPLTYTLMKEVWSHGVIP